jgi:hypothetical protein
MGPAQRGQRARGRTDPRTRPQPGPGPGKSLPAWAVSGPCARDRSVAVGSDPTVTRGFRWVKTHLRRARCPNPRAFPPAPRSHSSLLLFPPRDGGRRCGAAAGLLAGECARLDGSAPPSSGLGVASWPTHHGAVEIHELRDGSGCLGPFEVGGAPELLGPVGAGPWSR